MENVIKFLQEVFHKSENIWNAADGEDVKMIEELITKEGVNVNERNYCGETALHRVCENGNIEIMKLLIASKAELDVKADSGYSPLDIASRKGFVDSVRLLLEEKATVNKQMESGWSALHLSAFFKHNATVEILLEYKADPNSKDDQGFTAAQRGCHDIDRIKMLVEAKTDVHSRNLYNNQLIHDAAHIGNLEVIKYLVEECHADLWSRGEEDRIPLAFATNTDVIEYMQDIMKNDTSEHS